MAHCETVYKLLSGLPWMKNKNENKKENVTLVEPPSFSNGCFDPGGFTLEKNDGVVPARTKFYDPVLE